MILFKHRLTVGSERKERSISHENLDLKVALETIKGKINTFGGIMFLLYGCDLI